MAKKPSTESEIEKSPEPDKKKDKNESGNNSKDLKKSFEDFKQFLKDAFTELKKVQWPTRRQALGETAVVMITVFFLTILVVLFDKVLSWVFSLVF